MPCLDCFTGRSVHFYLILSRDCNLRCKFCYQPERFRDKQKMTVKVAEDSINWVIDNFGEDSVKFMLWGGEPFTNEEVITYLLGTYPQLQFTVVTNGYLITDELKEKLLKYKNNLFFSLSVANYRQEYPDYMERLKNALELVVKNGGDVHYVSSDPTTVYEDFLKLEAMGVSLIRLSVPRDVDLSDEILTQIEDQWRKVVDHVYFEKDFGLFRTNFDRALHSNLKRVAKGLPLLDSQPYFCGAGFNYMSVDVNGDVYPCDWLCGLDHFKYGNIYTGINEENVQRINQLEKNRIETYRKFCKDCEIPDIRLCPRAMCLAENLEATGDVEKPQKSHCKVNALEYRVGKYLVDRAIKEGKWS